jgi:hypothetical protein
MVNLLPAFVFSCPFWFGGGCRMEEEMYWEQHRRYDMEYFHRGGPMGPGGGMMGPRGPFMGPPGPMVSLYLHTF